MENQDFQQQGPDEFQAIIKSVEIFKEAPAILKTHRAKAEQAKRVGASILIDWQNANNITDPDQKMAALIKADERSNNFLLNCSAALKIRTEERAPITQLMDTFRGWFIAEEKVLDKKNAGVISDQVQQKRNVFATYQKKVEEDLRLANERIEKTKTEAINLNAQIETKIRTLYAEYLTKTKLKFQTNFNNIVLSTFDVAKAALIAYKPEFKWTVENELLTFNYQYHDKVGFSAILLAKKTETIESLAPNYTAEMSSLRDELVEKLPSKKAELDTAKKLADEAAETKRKNDEAEAERQKKIAAENDAAAKQKLIDDAKAQKLIDDAAAQKLIDDAAELERQKVQREKDEALQTVAQGNEAASVAAQEVESNRVGAATMAIFDTHVSNASFVGTGVSKTALEVEVLHPVGWSQVFQHWFVNIGNKMDIEKMGNTKLDQMAAWCAKFAGDPKGSKIQSEYVKYVPVTKARTTKKKED